MTTEVQPTQEAAVSGGAAPVTPTETIAVPQPATVPAPRPMFVYRPIPILGDEPAMPAAAITGPIHDSD